MTKKEILAERDKRANIYRDEDFKANPEGYTVSSYFNSETTSTAFEAGFNAAVKLMLEREDVLRAGLTFYAAALEAPEESTAGEPNLEMGLMPRRLGTLASEILNDVPEWKE